MLNPNARLAASKSATDRVQGVSMSRVADKMGAFATTRAFRRLVLGTAFFLALAVSVAPRAPLVYAQEPKTAAPPASGQRSTDPPKLPAVPDTPKLPGAPEVPKGGKSLTVKDGRGGEIKIDVTEGGKASVTRTKPAETDVDPDVDGTLQKRAKKRAQITIDGLPDKEFDSFDEFVRDEPALAAMVVLIVATVFFAPVLAIALILWYRMRKARMLNETMLKLAEKGIVPTPEAIGALGGKPAAAAAAMAPYYEQAKQVRRRAAWSDLRKGVLMAGFGLALSLHSLITSRSPNIVGLVLLFVGLGFVVLWWFEQRHLPAPDGVATGAMGNPAADPGAGVAKPAPGNPPPT
jgi:hypothetical protein